MRNGRLTFTPAAVDTDGYCLSQTIAAAGTLSLNGTLVTDGVGIHNSVCIVRESRDNQSRTTTGASLVTVISLGSNESGITLTISGTNEGGKSISETLTGPGTSATVTTSLTFATITSITTSGALVGNITIGTSVIQVTPPLRPGQQSFEPFIIQIVVSNALTYTVQATADGSPIVSADVPYLDLCDLTARTSDSLGNIITPLGALKLKILAYTSGTVLLILGEASNG